MKLPRLKEVRELHGWSQTKLAEESDVSRDSISNYETGQREAYPATAKKLADALDVEIADLIEPAQELMPPKAEAPSTPGQPERKRPISDVVREAVLRQDEQDRQAFNRAIESELPQAYWKRHENDVMTRLLEYDLGEVAEAYINLMTAYMRLEQEHTQLARRVEALERQLQEVGT